MFFQSFRRKSLPTKTSNKDMKSVFGVGQPLVRYTIWRTEKNPNFFHIFKSAGPIQLFVLGYFWYWRVSLSFKLREAPSSKKSVSGEDVNQGRFQNDIW